MTVISTYEPSNFDVYIGLFGEAISHDMSHAALLKYFIVIVEYQILLLIQCININTNTKYKCLHKHACTRSVYHMHVLYVL